VTVRWITPLVHPASILRGRPALEPIQVAHLRRLAADPHPTPVDTSLAPPGCDPDPTLETLRWFTALVRTGIPGEVVVLDIENAGPCLVCCGLLRMHRNRDILPAGPDRGVCFRFRRQGGAPWWTNWDEHLEVVTLLDSILGDPHITKVGHFIIQHDLPLLLDLGFALDGPLIDTSVLCHAVHAEIPKGLQFLSTAMLGAPRWKDIPDEKEVGDRDTEEEGDRAE
jgi:hypothetical protein